MIEYADAIVASTPMPDGYELWVSQRRRYKYRSLWDVVVTRDGKRVWGRAYYNVALGVVEAQRWAREQAG